MNLSEKTRPASGAPVLDIRNLTVRLPKGADREHAVEGVSLSIAAREILCLVGESGSGKSITSFAVMGLLSKELVPVGGEILFQREDLLRASPERLRQLRGSRMSMIFQEPMTALNPVMTAGRQIEEVLTTHTDMSRDQRTRRVLEVIRAVSLPDPELIRRLYPHQLSGGQRQRVMIAAALALEPKLLIADEPTTALDVTTQAQILRILKEIQGSHDTAILFITHDIGVVAEIADRVVVMQSGRVVEQGDAGRVLDAPEHPYTKMLISSVPSLTPGTRAEAPVKPVALSVEGLSKIYRGTSFFGSKREVRAIDDVGFTVRGGRVLGVVGESGSGKTSVARCVMRLIDCDGGRIRLDGVDLAAASKRRLHDARKDVQMVFQDPYRSLNPRRTVGQSIIEGPMNFGVPKREAWERARRLMTLVSLDPDALSRYPHQFSGGQRQRICIARALAMEPRLLVADEIVSALDVTVQAQVLELLNGIREKFDLAILFITHDLRVAAKVCDEVAVMHRGRIVEMGSTSEIFASPKHEYTRSLLAAVPGRTWSAEAGLGAGGA
ncbi:ABC transporter ATP-binding protein [Chelativorans xinjiangense]|uniref:ABC transporter ATP-binding protein n=1 Tax=Chelativorans xinjiangense TaxID=2681485 RepID=UPI0013570DD1|nr:ABC transporter ATP-binding protein [Chelativorans xinjiangense]